LQVRTGRSLFALCGDPVFASRRAGLDTYRLGWIMQSWLCFVLAERCQAGTAFSCVVEVLVFDLDKKKSCERCVRFTAFANATGGNDSLRASALRCLRQRKERSERPAPFSSRSAPARATVSSHFVRPEGHGMRATPFGRATRNGGARAGRSIQATYVRMPASVSVAPRRLGRRGAGAMYYFCLRAPSGQARLS
jgi:hypothetical protein